MEGLRVYTRHDSRWKLQDGRSVPSEAELVLENVKHYNNNNNKALFQAHMAHKMNTNVCKNTQCASGLCHR